jgi:hypothetical protein
MRLDRESILRSFGDVWPVHVRALNEFLIACRQHFGGDLDRLLILSVIGDRTLTAERAKGIPYSAFLEGQRGPGAPKPINTQSIADSTGIPRETVRRKVSELIERGWVCRRDDGTLHATDKAATDLAPLTEATFDYFLAVGNALMSGARANQGNEARGPLRSGVAQSRPDAESATG